jgi:RNA polymerase sigma-70 factor (ECF subfamily)
MNETQAIKLCLIHKDPSGFEFLVKKFRKEAYMHALILVKNRDDAFDACQEAFKKAFYAFPKLTGLDSFYPWFYTILRNTCFNFLTHVKREKRMKQTIMNSVDPNDYIKPDFLVENREKNSQIISCLNLMSPELREILFMKYYKDYSYATISKLLSIPKGTVMSRLYNARKSFQKLYLGKIIRRSDHEQL